MPDFTLDAPAELEPVELEQLTDGGFTLEAFPIDLEPGPAEVVSLRAPQYGIPLADRQSFLAQQLPNGTPRYVGLFASMPDRAGIGGTEAAGSGYARVEHSAWRSVIVGGFIARRVNTGEVRLSPLVGDLTVVGWGAWDSATGGTLRAFGLLRGSDLSARIFELTSTDEPGWLDGRLVVGIL